MSEQPIVKVGNVSLEGMESVLPWYVEKEWVEIPFNASWVSQNGYFDGAVSEPLEMVHEPCFQKVYVSKAPDGRRLLLVPTPKDGNIVLVERFTPGTSSTVGWMFQIPSWVQPLFDRDLDGEFVSQILDGSCVRKLRMALFNLTYRGKAAKEI